MKCTEEYLNKHLIAYIGNKRRLLPLIEKAINKTKITEKNDNPVFLDLFAGTGVISRLAKILGFKVISNDWEYYSYIMNKAFVELDNNFLKSSYKKLGGIEHVLSVLNNLEKPNKKDKYISEYYCPENDSNPDVINERLFYTSYNGKKIDAIRAKIEEWHKKKLIDDNEKNLLLALLLYEASTRSNTSGVFKGFHKGFGGTNGDALTRILKKVELNKPILINGNKAEVIMEDAVRLVNKLNKKMIDITYIDPPYNQHQYGSNYHLLNTIAYNDKPAVNKNIYINGRKTNKSAIRKDWIKTRSGFCYKQTAEEDFRNIIESLNTKYILVSYSTDGIINFNKMLDILSKKGKIDMVSSSYTKYRGGKQALTTQINNIEFVLIIDTQKKGSQRDVEKIQKQLLMNKINILLKKTVNPIRTEACGFYFKHIKEKNSIERYFVNNYENNEVILMINNNKIINHNLSKSLIKNFNYKILHKIYEDIKYMTDLTKEDEIYLAIEELSKAYKRGDFKDAIQIFNNIPYCISKFNNKKAYIPSLKCIISVLEMLIQTKNIWSQNDLLDNKNFKKLEKVILIKLNYNIKKEILSNDRIQKENAETINKVTSYKKQIGNLYDYLVSELEKANKKNENKINNELKYINLNMICHTKSHNYMAN